MRKPGPARWGLLSGAARCLGILGNATGMALNIYPFPEAASTGLFLDLCVLHVQTIPFLYHQEYKNVLGL